jgi:hypothetical protein
MALPQEVIDAEVSKMQKCIISWKIIKIDLWEKQEQCFQDIKVILKWENWYYSFNSDILVDECTYDGFYEKFNKDFVNQTWKNEKFLIDSENNLIISKENYDFKKYPNLEACKPNIKNTTELQDIYYKLVLQDHKNEIFNSKNSIYYLWWLILVIVLLLVLIYKTLNKLKK